MSAKVDLDPATLENSEVYKIVTGCIVPRPIGLISTVSSKGVPNIAPFSFFNGISHIPPLVCFSASYHYRSNAQKDTLTNAIETNEFVANVVDEDLASATDVCSQEFLPEIDEFKVAGLTPAPAKRVKAPLVEESPVNFECQVVQVIPLPESVYTLVIGRIIYMHLRKDVLLPKGRIDLSRLAAIGRMTGNSYTRTRDVFTMDHDAYDVVHAADK